jgi:hypothetical protein
MTAYETITTKEVSVRQDPMARRALDALRQLQASVEVGLQLETYAGLVAQATLPVNDFVRLRGDAYPVFGGRLQDTLESHRQLLFLWRSTPTGAGGGFLGGGFGIAGFLIGAAIATGLNAMVDSAERKQADKLAGELRAGWSKTSAVVNMLEDALSGFGEITDTKMLEAPEAQTEPASGREGQKPTRVNFTQGNE